MPFESRRLLSSRDGRRELGAGSPSLLSRGCAWRAWSSLAMSPHGDRRPGLHGTKLRSTRAPRAQPRPLDAGCASATRWRTSGPRTGFTRSGGAGAAPFFDLLPIVRRALAEWTKLDDLISQERRQRELYQPNRLTPLVSFFVEVHAQILRISPNKRRKRTSEEKRSSRRRRAICETRRLRGTLGYAPEAEARKRTGGLTVTITQPPHARSAQVSAGPCRRTRFFNTPSRRPPAVDCGRRCGGSGEGSMRIAVLREHGPSSERSGRPSRPFRAARTDRPRFGEALRSEEDRARGRSWRGSGRVLQRR